MLKFTFLIFCLVSLVDAVAFTCYTPTITPVTLGGNLPLGATNLTDVPAGTNCTYKFDIPKNYVLLFKFSSFLVSDQDSVTIFDANNFRRFTLKQTTGPIYDRSFWMPATSTAIEVVGKTGNSKFMVSYTYQRIDQYKQVLKNTGEYFILRSIADNTYVTFKTASINEQVIVTPGMRTTTTDSQLINYFVYDGDNINTANFLGRLSEFQSRIIKSTGQYVSIVPFTEYKSFSYVLGNDASTLKGYGAYSVIMTSKGSTFTDVLEDVTNKGSAYTFICTDCSTFYFSKLAFQHVGNVANGAYITLQGQTPTHKREQLIRYDPNTLTVNQFPQMLPTNVFTMNLYLGKAEYYLNTVNDDTAWKKPYIGRKGYIFSPSLWSSLPNSFSYDFRDDSQNFNFTVNMQKMLFPASSDQMTLKIGSGTGTPSVNNQYPRDQSSNSKVMGYGSYMQVGLSASVGADVRLSFEIQKGNGAGAVAVFISMVLTLIYNF